MALLKFSNNKIARSKFEFIGNFNNDNNDDLINFIASKEIDKFFDKYDKNIYENIIELRKNNSNDIEILKALAEMLNIKNFEVNNLNVKINFETDIKSAFENTQAEVKFIANKFECEEKIVLSNSKKIIGKGKDQTSFIFNCIDINIKNSENINFRDCIFKGNKENNTISISKGIANFVNVGFENLVIQTDVNAKIIFDNCTFYDSVQSINAKGDSSLEFINSTFTKQDKAFIFLKDNAKINNFNNKIQHLILEDNNIKATFENTKAEVKFIAKKFECNDKIVLTNSKKIIGKGKDQTSFIFNCININTENGENISFQDCMFKGNKENNIINISNGIANFVNVGFENLVIQTDVNAKIIFESCTFYDSVQSIIAKGDSSLEFINSTFTKQDKTVIFLKDNSKINNFDNKIQHLILEDNEYTQKKRQKIIIGLSNYLNNKIKFDTDKYRKSNNINEKVTIIRVDIIKKMINHKIKIDPEFENELKEINHGINLINYKLNSLSIEESALRTQEMEISNKIIQNFGTIWGLTTNKIHEINLKKIQDQQKELKINQEPLINNLSNQKKKLLKIKKELLNKVCEINDAINIEYL